MSIYKPCDIRGQVAGELTPELYRRWGAALGSSLPPLAKFVVGGDVRDSTPAFQDALVDGLCGEEIDAIDLGQLPTPMIYHAKSRLNADGCAIVTGSHNAAEINGLKWLLGNDPPGPDEVQHLRDLAQRPAESNGRTRSEPRSLDISFDYVAWLQEMWVDSLRSHCHVVLDSMHGCWAALRGATSTPSFPSACCRPFTIAAMPASTATAPIAPVPSGSTSFARRSTGSAPTWGWPSTATATAWRWWITKGWP